MSVYTLVLHLFKRLCDSFWWQLYHRYPWWLCFTKTSRTTIASQVTGAASSQTPPFPCWSLACQWRFWDHTPNSGSTRNPLLIEGDCSKTIRHAHPFFKACWQNGAFTKVNPCSWQTLKSVYTLSIQRTETSIVQSFSPSIRFIPPDGRWMKLITRQSNRLGSIRRIHSYSHKANQIALAQWCVTIKRVHAPRRKPSSCFT